MNRRLPQWIWVVALIIAVGAALMWRVQQPYPIYDTYPIYFGTQAWLRTGNAYDLDAAVDPTTLYVVTDERTGETRAPYATQMHPYGNAYPLPALMLTLPWNVLPVRLASIIWLSSLVAGLMVALRWAGASLLLLFYWPIVQGLRLEQYALVVLMAQIVAVAAYWRRDHLRHAPLIVAFCCAIMLTKPTQGAVLAVALMWQMRRHWRMFGLALLIVWGLPTLLDPNWPLEWVRGSTVYRDTSEQTIAWWLLFFVVPLLLNRDWITGAIIVQLALFPYTWVYAAMSLPVGLIHDRRVPLLVILSLLWTLIAVALLGPFAKATAELIAIALTMVLPVVALSLLRWRNNSAILI